MVARKPDSTRQDTHRDRALVAVENIGGVAPLDVHPECSHWLKATKTDWADLWAADVSQAYGRQHLPAIYPLFDFRDAQARALGLYRSQPMVDGSMGQPVSNPALAAADKLEKSITALEDRLGLTPKAQASLGIAIGQHQLTAAELNKLAAGSDDDDDDRSSGDVADPSGKKPKRKSRGQYVGAVDDLARLRPQPQQVLHDGGANLPEMTRTGSVLPERPHIEMLTRRRW